MCLFATGLYGVLVLLHFALTLSTQTDRFQNLRCTMKSTNPGPGAANQSPTIIPPRFTDGIRFLLECSVLLSLNTYTFVQELKGH